jgi:hypothetical protein
MKIRIPVSIILMAAISIGSLCPKDEETEITGPVSFTVLPIDFDAIFRATPLGNTNPPGHVFPTNHIGFYLNGTDLVEVRALANGTVKTVYYNAGIDDYRVECEHTSTFCSYFDHIEDILPAIREGAAIHAGDLIGYGNPATGAVDLGVVDYEITRNFITAGRYHEFYLHCGDPYVYFTDSLRTLLLTKNPRTEEPRGGKIDFDIDGRLCGNWFLEGTPVTWEASSYLYAESQLAFVYDKYDPAQIRITCGGTLALAHFDRPVVGNGPDPSTISISSGLIKYDISVSSPLQPPGVFLVQMLDTRRIRAEVFPELTPAEVTNFTAAAEIYVR